MVGKLKIHKSTIIFKINDFKLTEKYPKPMRSSVTLTFLQKVCEDNLRNFKWVKSHFFKKIIKIKLTKMFRQTFPQALQDF